MISIVRVEGVWDVSLLNISEVMGSVAFATAALTAGGDETRS